MVQKEPRADLPENPPREKEYRHSLLYLILSRGRMDRFVFSHSHLQGEEMGHTSFLHVGMHFPLPF